MPTFRLPVAPQSSGEVGGAAIPRLNLRNTVSLCLLASYSPLPASIEIGRGFLTPELSGSTEYTTNASARANAKEDWIHTLTPSFNYQTVGSATQISLDAGIRIVRFAERPESDSENFFATANLSYPNGMKLPYSISATLGLEENTSADSEFGQVTRDRSYQFGTNGSYRFTSRYSGQLGITYTQREPLGQTVENRQATESIAMPLSLSYRYSETLSYGFGYRLREQKTDSKQGINDGLSHATFIVATGQLLPRVQADVQIGAQAREVDGSYKLSPYASGGLDWQATSLTAVSISLSADVETTTGNRSSQTIEVDTSVRHNFATNLDALFELGLQQQEFSQPGEADTRARSDFRWTVGAGLETSLYEHLHLSLKLSYEDNHSDDRNFDYDALSLTLSGSRPF